MGKHSYHQETFRIDWIIPLNFGSKFGSLGRKCKNCSWW